MLRSVTKPRRCSPCGEHPPWHSPTQYELHHTRSCILYPTQRNATQRNITVNLERVYLNLLQNQMMEILKESSGPQVCARGEISNLGGQIYPAWMAHKAEVDLDVTA
jgi:hypothetical protein